MSSNDSNRVPMPHEPVPRPGRSRLPLGLTALCVALTLSGQTGLEWLRFDRAAIVSGQLWRLLTGHLVHLGWPHLAMNLAGLWLIWRLYGHSLGDRQWLGLTAGSSVGISLALLALDPKLGWYVGLSGVLHTLIVVGIVVELRRHPLPGEWILLVLIVAKLVWEQLHGSLPGSAELAGGPVIVDAHLYGALIGLPAGLWLARHPPFPPNPKDPLR